MLLNFIIDFVFLSPYGKKTKVKRKTQKYINKRNTPHLPTKKFWIRAYSNTNSLNDLSSKPVKILDFTMEWITPISRISM